MNIHHHSRDPLTIHPSSIGNSIRSTIHSDLDTAHRAVAALKPTLNEDEVQLSHRLVPIVTASDTTAYSDILDKHRCVPTKNIISSNTTNPIYEMALANFERVQKEAEALKADIAKREALLVNSNLTISEEDDSRASDTSVSARKLDDNHSKKMASLLSDLLFKLHF